MNANTHNNLCSTSDTLNPTQAGHGVIAILVCPGPRFGGKEATTFVQNASAVCQANAQVVLDVSEVVAMDVVGLLAIASLARLCQARGTTLRLCSPNQSVRMLLATAGVHRLADIYHTRRHAGL